MTPPFPIILSVLVSLVQSCRNHPQLSLVPIPSIFLPHSVPSLPYIPNSYSVPCLAPHELNSGSCPSHSSLVQPHLPLWMTHPVCFLHLESHNGCTAGHGDFLLFAYVTGDDMQLAAQTPSSRDSREI